MLVNTERKLLKAMVSGAYDIQHCRIIFGNRLLMNLKIKMGMDTKIKEEEEEDQEVVSLIKQIRHDYDKLMDGVKHLIPNKKFVAEGIISDYAELCLFHQYIELERAEKQSFSHLLKKIEPHPLYDQFLKDVRGVGPAMSAVIISEIDIHKAKYISCIYRYAGLDVAEDGRGRGRYKEHLREYEYTDKKGEIKTKKGITFNPFLQEKLLGVLAGCFIRAGRNPYQVIYANYKNRLNNHPLHKDKSKLHKHKMSMRYMIKIFLYDVYKVWRKIEGLEVHTSYAEGKLGIIHTQDTGCSELIYPD